MGFDKISQFGKDMYQNNSKSTMRSELSECTNTENTSILNKRKRTKYSSLLPGLALIAGLYIGASILAWLGYLSNNNNIEQIDVEMTRLRRQASRNVITNISTTPAVTSFQDDVTTVGVNLSEANDNSQGIYPTDLFDLQSRKRGAVVLHVLGMLYMFIALAVVCDEFFVPALEVIIRRLQISDDVAGATFMAAGGSAPELFTSIIGVFLAKSNVGIGTIVGSAVFNILFVIGMCSLFSHEVLSLTWWPLFRDCLFYIISLIALIVSFSDATIQFYECIVMISIYICYVAFMKYNRPIEVWVKGKINSTVSVTSSNNHASKENGKSSKSVRAIENSINQPSDHHNGKSTFSYGIVQLMMNTLDPATDETTQAKSSRLYAIARMKLISPQAARTLSAQPSGDRDNRADVNEVGPNGAHATVIYENEGVKVAPQNNNASNHPSVMQNMPSNGSENTQLENNKVVGYERNKNDSENIANEVEVAMKVDVTSPNSKKFDDGSMSDMNETLDLAWPKSCTKRCVYILLAPIMLSLWITLPDVRNPKREKYFMVSFFGSIAWIAVFSYLMVWLAHQVGETVGLSEAVMGLTFLAAGTSVPDLITSVIVARKGLGDMAVSSSVGSNIFDVTIGLPLPWLIYSLTQMGKPILVESKGLFCSVLLLFIMLLLVVGSIAASRWRMNKGLGLSMLALYAVFLTFSLLLEFSIIGCPVGGS